MIKHTHTLFCAIFFLLTFFSPAQAGLFGPSNKGECILEYVPKANSRFATYRIQQACDDLFNKGKSGKKYAKCILDLNELFEAKNDTAASVILRNSSCEGLEVDYVFESPEGDEYKVTGPRNLTKEQALSLLQSQIGRAQPAKTNKPKSHLEKIAFDMNKKLPMKLDSETTALSVEAYHGSRDKLIFWYQLPNIHKNHESGSFTVRVEGAGDEYNYIDVSPSMLVDAHSQLKTQVVSGSCQDKNTAALLKKGVIFDYKYRDNTGALLSNLNFSIERSDCQY